MKSISQLLSFDGKTSLITGAANGIGRAIAARLAEAGSDLYLIDVDEKNLSKLQKELSDFKTKVKICLIDLSFKEDIDRFWSSIRDENIDILINNAGIYPFVDFLKLNESYLEKVMNINLYSVMWMCQHFIKKNIKKGGVIINMGSIEAILPFKKDLTQYSMSKVGVITLTRDLAREYAGKNFRVNAILPGGILTEGTKSAAKKAIRQLDFGLMSDGYNFKQRLPAKRFGKPDEIAKMVLALSSDMASYVHGALIPVDGGFLSS